MAKNLIDLGDRVHVGAHGMENPEEILEPKELDVSRTIASEQSVTLRNKRSVVKRKITIHLKALSSEIEQFGSKFRIPRIIADLKQCLQEAEVLNVQYLAFTSKVEHDKILEWYDVEFGRVNDALDEALTHLNERESEETSQATSVSRRSKVSSKSDPVVIKAKAAAAQAFVKRQRESAKEKLRELERQAELQMKLWKAKEKVERLGREGSGRSPARMVCLAEGTAESSRVLSTTVLSPRYGFSHLQFSCTCLMMQVRKHSGLLHTFDLSIPVERDSVPL